MKKHNKLKDVWAVYLFIALLTLIMVIGVANATPTSRIVAEPEFLEPGEPDDGKYAMMLNKGILCDKEQLVFGRYINQGYFRAFRAINGDFHTYIMIQSTYYQGKYYINKLAILEVDTKTRITCVISENTNPEYNENYIYLEIHPGEQL